MCLSVPSRVIEIHDDETATVEALGVQRRVTTQLLLEPLNIGDYVLLQSGLIMSILDKQTAEDSLKLYQKIAGKLTKSYKLT